MGTQEQTQPQGKQMSEEDKISQEGVTLELTTEAVAKGELTGIDLPGSDKGDSEKVKMARTGQGKRREAENGSDSQKKKSDAEKLRGFSRVLDPERIIGATDSSGKD